MNQPDATPSPNDGKGQSVSVPSGQQSFPFLPNGPEGFPFSGESLLDDILDLKIDLCPLPVLGRNDVLMQGASHIIAGQPKTGKSTLLRSISYQLALDDHRVLFISEEFPVVWKKRSLDLGFEKSGRHFVVIHGLGMGSDVLLRRALTGTENVVVVDTLSTLLDVHPINSADAVVQALRPWLRVCGFGKSLILSHHQPKRLSRSDPVENVAGSFALQAIVDSVLLYTQDARYGDENLRRLHMRSRLLDQEVSFGIRKNGPTFEVIGDPAERILTEDEKAVWLALDDALAKTLKDVMTATGFVEVKARRLLTDLTRKKLVKDVTGHSGKGGRGNEARWLRREQEELE